MQQRAFERFGIRLSDRDVESIAAEIARGGGTRLFDYNKRNRSAVRFHVDRRALIFVIDWDDRELTTVLKERWAYEVRRKMSGRGTGRAGRVFRK